MAGMDTAAEYPASPAAGGAAEASSGGNEEGTAAVSIPDVMRRAMEAQGVNPDEIAAKAADAIPTDEEEAERQAGRPKAATPEEEADRELGLTQPTLMDDQPLVLTYEMLLPAADVETYKRVKRWTMRLAETAREIVAEQIGAVIGDGGRSDKQFLQTPHGTFRLAMGHNSDNTTERAALDRMGVTTIHLDDPAEVMGLYAQHRVPSREAYDALVRRLQRAF